MLGSFRENQRETPFAQHGQNIVADELVAAGIFEDGLVKAKKLGPDIFKSRFSRTKSSRADKDVMREGTRSSLLPGVDAMTDRPALHENNRMMPVLASHRGRKADDVF